MEGNNEETPALPFESPTEMGLNSLEDPGSGWFHGVLSMFRSAYPNRLGSGVIMEVNNEEMAGALPLESTTNSLEDPGSGWFDGLLVKFRSAYPNRLGSEVIMEVNNEETAGALPFESTTEMGLNSRLGIEVNNEETAGALPFESTTEMGLNSRLGIEVNNEETAGALPSESTTEMGLNSLKDPGPEVLVMFRSAYDEERAINSTCNAHLFFFFATFLFWRCVDQISLYPVFFFFIYPVFFCSAFTPLFLYFYINHTPFLFLEEDVKWLRRELRLLDAISKDAKEVASISASIDAKAHEIWESKPINRLDESETAWLGIAESKARAAKEFVSTFEKVEREIRGDSHTNRICLAMLTKNFLRILDLFLRILDLFRPLKDAKKKIDEIFVKKKGINICESLESVLSLRPLYQGDQQKLTDSKGRVAEVAKSTSSVSDNMKRLISELIPDSTTREKARSLELQLLPFLKDLGGSPLESEIERAWMEEAKEFITEADTSVHNLTAARKTWWLPIISRWNARRKLKGVISNIDTRFSELLERKDRYGFKFVRRDSSKVVFQSPRKTIYDTDASSVLNSVRKDLSDESGLLTEVLEEVTRLCDQLESMVKLVEDAAINDRFNSRMVWLERAREIVELAGNSLETFKKHQRLKAGGRIKFCEQIDQISQDITIVMRCINTFGIELREESNSVGLEEDIQTLVSRLRSSQHGFVVSITGIAGIGKTTLAKEVYNHQDIVDYFSCRAWVTLHKTSNQNEIVVEEVAKALMEALKLEKEENCNASWIQKVHDLLNEKKCLVVLDNVSEIEELNSLNLKAELPVPSSGSRILLTACKNIFGSPADNLPHQIQLRSTKESWKLFNQMVQFPLEQEKLAKKILGKCGGVPLAILCLGYLLSGKDVNKAEELRKLLQYITQNDNPLIQMQNFTRRFIESVPKLFSCLSYLKLFPKDFNIPARRLIALWIAEDLVEVSGHNSKTYEDVAYEYLIQLIDGGVIQVVERKHNGEVKKCRLPYAVVQKLELENMSSRRITDHFNRSDESFGHIHGESSSVPSSYRGIVSILSFDTREGNKPGAEIGNFLRGVIAGGFFERLKVLDLERVFRPELPDTIGRSLSKLRYLGLRWTYLQLIPSSIGTLQNLQTLDVKHTYIHTLPSSIWKLQKLRHLYLNQSCQSKSLRQQGGSSLKNLQTLWGKSLRQQGGSSLKNLQTLWGVFVDKDSPLKDGMDKLLNLRKLGLEFQLTSLEQEALSEKIVKLKHLKSLRMRSINGTGKSGDLFLKPLVVLENLCNLNLFGKLNPPIIPEFPKSLIDLTLSASSLSDDPMPKLEKLPNLKVLCFYSESFIGNKMTCSTLGFPQLVVLKLWKLENLQEWDVEEKAMQNLRELEIRSCKKLSVPSGLKHLITLNELKLTNMPEEFAAAIAITRGKIWEGLNHCPAIIAVNWESTW